MAVGDEGGFEKIGGEEAVTAARVDLDADDENSPVCHPDDLRLRRFTATESSPADAV